MATGSIMKTIPGSRSKKSLDQEQSAGGHYSPGAPLRALHDEVFIAQPLHITPAIAAAEPLPFSIFPNPRRTGSTSG